MMPQPSNYLPPVLSPVETTLSPVDVEADLGVK